MGNNNTKVSGSVIAGLERILSHKDYIMRSLTLDELSLLLQQELSNNTSGHAKGKGIGDFYAATRYQFETGPRGSWLERPKIIQIAPLSRSKDQLSLQVDLIEVQDVVANDKNSLVEGSRIDLSVKVTQGQRKGNQSLCLELQSDVQFQCVIDLRS